MPGGDNAETNAAVLADRINRLQADVDDLGMTISNTREQVNILSSDKLSRAEFVEWTNDAREWREEVVKHLTMIDGRLGMWAGGNVILTIIAGIIAAIVGRGP